MKQTKNQKTWPKLSSACPTSAKAGTRPQVGARLLEVGIWGAFMNVKINLKDVTDAAYTARVEAEGAALAARAKDMMAKTLAALAERGVHVEATAVAAPGETGPWIFNVRTDASERVNLHDSPAHADVRKRLYAALARYNASAVPCRLCYAKPDPAAAPAPVKGLDVCTPAPVDADDPTMGSRPILCEDVGVWRPWRD